MLFFLKISAIFISKLILYLYFYRVLKNARMSTTSVTATDHCVFQLRNDVRLRCGSGVPSRHIHRDIVLRQVPRVRQRSGHIWQLLGFYVPATVPRLPDRQLRLQVQKQKQNSFPSSKHYVPYTTLYYNIIIY